MNLYVLGDSHTRALGEGYAAREEAAWLSENEIMRIMTIISAPATLREFFKKGPDWVEFSDPDVTRRLEMVTGERKLRSAEGSEIYAFSLGLMPTAFIRMNDWRKFAPLTGSLPGRPYSLVSSGVIEAMARAHNEYARRFFEACQEVGVRFLVVEAPPLRRDDLAIKKGVTSAAAQSLDDLMRRTMLQTYGEMGIRVVRYPAAAVEQTESGSFLRSDMHRIKEGDTHHANGRFGAAILPDIVAAAREVVGST